MHNNKLPDVLIVMALKVESQEVFERENIPVLYTGLGKVNAAYALTRRLADYRYAGGQADGRLPLVVNFGSAGSRSFATGSVVACREFIQRDMDVRPLGFDLGVTPLEDGIPAMLEFPEFFPELAHGVCGSGDSFETGATKLACDVVDMEAYALAKVCWLEQARFACAKYITDGADDAAATDWQSNLPRAAAEFFRLYRTLKT